MISCQEGAEECPRTLYLYGVAAHTGLMRFARIGFGGTEVRTAPWNGLCGIVGASPQTHFERAAREDLVRLLLAHQSALENVMKHVFVLPFRFGTTLRDESELHTLLAEGQSLLSGLIRKMEAFVEVDVIATWEVLPMVREIAEKDPVVLAARNAPGGGMTDPEEIGRRIGRALGERAEDKRNRILTALQSIAADSAEHVLLNDEMVFNASFLIGREQEGEFHKRVCDLDRWFDGRVNFKCVGPLPPYSFASVTVRRFDPIRIERAAKTFMLDAAAPAKLGMDDIRKVYRALAREYHPDATTQGSAARFEDLADAYRVLSEYCADGPRSLRPDDVVRTIRLAVRRAPEVPYGC